jgi:predicted transposase YbfD/YdcC
MKLKPKITIADHFDLIEDPRIERTKLHDLNDIITIAICAVICGADTWTEIEEYGKAKQKWLNKFLKLSNGIPSHDTFSRVFARINPEQFQTSFINWIKSISNLTEGEVVAIDGKTLRHSYDKGKDKAAIHMVSAWATNVQLVLGQLKVDDKSNEITAIPELIKLLSLKGCIVSIDAMGCQKSIVKQIIEQEADYIIALKKNQKNLYNQVEALFKDAIISKFQEYEHTEHRLVDESHGRTVTRYYSVLNNVGHLLDLNDEWANLYSIGKVDTLRISNSKTKLESRYYIMSIDRNAKFFSNAIRSHWQIENCLHWVLDVQFHEDNSRIRKDNAPANFAVLRHIAHSFITQEKSSKVGVNNKRKKAGWDNDYLVKLLTT